MLEDRFADHRFRRGHDDPQLACLTDAQRAEWMKPVSYTSVWLDPDSEVIFRERTRAAAQLAGTTLTALESAFGSVDDARARHREVVDELRGIDKNDPARIEKAQLAQRRAQELQLLLNLTEVSRLGDRADPARTAALKDWFRKHEIKHNANYLAPLQEVLETKDLHYTSGDTYEDPPASQRFALSAVVCLQWPDAAVLSECTDANKHMICTNSDKYGIVQGSLRIVERYEGAKKKRPLLVMERIYPDYAIEEKKRLIDHALERARALSMPLALPEEYFWGCEQFTRTGLAADGKGQDDGVHIPSMDASIEELARKRCARLLAGKVLRVKATMGPYGVEYIDSAPLGGAAARGQAQARRYELADAYYENQFVVLIPKRGGD